VRQDAVSGTPAWGTVIDMTQRENELIEWEEWTLDDGVRAIQNDDTSQNDHLLARLPQIFETVTRIGGEVCRLRAEVDGLLEQNASLILKFERLKEVIEEKGHLNLDDFELACEVMGADESSESSSLRKNRH
jgi:regulator of replication initiation timing